MLANANLGNEEIIVCGKGRATSRPCIWTQSVLVVRRCNQNVPVKVHKARNCTPKPEYRLLGYRDLIPWSVLCMITCFYHWICHTSKKCQIPLLALLPVLLPSHSDVWRAPEHTEKAQRSVYSESLSLAPQHRVITSCTGN